MQVFDEGMEVARMAMYDGVATVIGIPSPKLWSPSFPFLYTMNITNGDDRVEAYFALRTFTLGKDSKGVTRPMLNNEPIFMAGWLDQSYWPDGIYTGCFS